MPPPRISFVSLGCAKNLIDTEKMLGLLGLAGFHLVAPGQETEAIIINTCGFIDAARREAMEHIADAVNQKKSGNVRHVIVTGCLAQLWREKLSRQMPEIDAVVPLAQRDHIAEIVREIIEPNDTTPAVFRDSGEYQTVANDQARLRITEYPWSYLRISEGCDRKCSFCTIPAIRGSFRSKTPENIIAEATELIADGAVELNLIGQETSGYGTDISYTPGLAGLLNELNQLDQLKWLRVLYMHPTTMTDDQIAAIADCEKVVPYIDLPLQHINDRILKLMNRKINRGQTENLIKKLRQTIDNLTIRTTMLVGFPSETQEEFVELLDFVRQYRFEALGAFAYSAEQGTPAARMKGQLAPEVMQQRLEQLMLAQQEIAFEQAQLRVGQKIQCLITSRAGENEISRLNLDPQQQWLIGRHSGQAPEVDGICYLAVEKNAEIKTGCIATALVNDSYDYDLICQVC